MGVPRAPRCRVPARRVWPWVVPGPVWQPPPAAASTARMTPACCAALRSGQVVMKVARPGSFGRPVSPGDRALPGHSGIAALGVHPLPWRSGRPARTAPQWTGLVRRPGWSPGGEIPMASARDGGRDGPPGCPAGVTGCSGTVLGPEPGEQAVNRVAVSAASARSELCGAWRLLRLSSPG